VVKSTSIDPSVIGPDGIFHHSDPPGSSSPRKQPSTPSRTVRSNRTTSWYSSAAAPQAPACRRSTRSPPALKWLPSGKHVALLTDARFSGVSTGACIGHISPEALAGGAIGKLLDGDQIEIIIDREKLTGSVNLVGDAREHFGPEEGAIRLRARRSRADLRPHPALPDDTRLWAALVQASGGVWGGCVYDVDAIISRLTNV